jgi:hypothetical protein
VGGAILNPRPLGHVGHRGFAAREKLTRRRVRGHRGVNPGGLFQVEHGVGAQQRSAPGMEVALVVGIVPLPEHHRRPPRAFLNAALQGVRLVDGQPVGRGEAGAGRQPDLDAAIWLVRDQIARNSCGPRLMPGTTPCASRCRMRAVMRSKVDMASPSPQRGEAEAAPHAAGRGVSMRRSQIQQESALRCVTVRVA